MQFDAALQAFGVLHQQYGAFLDTALLVFVRMLGFTTTGPIFNRKNIPIVVKVIMAIYLTTTLMWLVPVEKHGSFINGEHGYFLIQIAVNVLVGAFIGFIGDLILQAAYAAGALMTNQIGLSMASLMDPSQGRQVMILESLFSLLTIIIFMHMGGVHWLIIALERSFETFPLYALGHDLNKAVNIDYLITLSGNVILIGVQLMAPIFVVTMAVDIMLGIVNRAAQQMPVFQLSFALKPAIGVSVLLITMPIFLQALQNFLNDFANIY